mgnify:CR=1 FL=1
MNDLIITVIQFVFFYYMTKIFVKGMLILMEGKRQAKLAEMAELEEISHRVLVEKHGDIYYWFDQDDGEFLGQGKDTQSIIETIKSRFPKHIFFVQSENSVYSIHAPSWEFKHINI